MDFPPQFAQKTRRLSAAKKRGITYENKVHKWLLEKYPDQYVPSPWIQFCAPNSRPEWAQPDGLLIDVRAGTIVIVEMKHSHTVTAWWQLRRKYQPLIRHLFGEDWSIHVCEITRWLDPALVFPEEIVLRGSPVQATDDTRFQVTKYTGKSYGRRK